MPARTEYCSMQKWGDVFDADDDEFVEFANSPAPPVPISSGAFEQRRQVRGPRRAEKKATKVTSKVDAEHKGDAKRESEDVKWMVRKFKSFPCKKGGSSASHDQECCQFYHSALDRRRFVYDKNGEYRYEAKPCDQQFDSTKACSRRDHCNLCHNTAELLYHPDRFRRRLCDQAKGCARGRLCPDAHSQQELLAPQVNAQEEKDPNEEFIPNREEKPAVSRKQGGRQLPKEEKENDATLQSQGAKSDVYLSWYPAWDPSAQQQWHPMMNCNVGETEYVNYSAGAEPWKQDQHQMVVVSAWGQMPGQYVWNGSLIPPVDGPQPAESEEKPVLSTASFKENALKLLNLKQLESKLEKQCRKMGDGLRTPSSFGSPGSSATPSAVSSPRPAGSSASDDTAVFIPWRSACTSEDTTFGFPARSASASEDTTVS